MFKVIEYGEILLNLLNEVGDWLMYTPDSLTLYSPLTELYFEVPNPFGSVGTMIFGGGLIFILGFRLIKFFTDIVL